MPAEIQWIAFCEGFRFRKFIIKELSVMCVQTKQFYTFHICPTIADGIDVDLDNPLNKELLAQGIAKHGMSWSAGRDQFEDVKDQLHQIISTDADVFVNDNALCSLLVNKWDYTWSSKF